MNFVDLFIFTAVFITVLVFAPIGLYVTGNEMEAGLVASATWCMVMGYESGLIPQWKREIVDLSDWESDP